MKKIYLVDGNSFIYRMFFGLPEFATKEGKIVNAVFGMAKFFVHQLVREKPDYLVFVKDAKGENFRHELYADYKATRDRMPDNLRSQISDIEEIIGMMGIDIIEIDGYEADDVIGTLATTLGADPSNDVYVLTGDKDLYSLVTKNVRIYDTMKKKVFGIDETIEKFGIDPHMIIDYLSICGDKSDNIPGIDGFGPKKALTLINDIGGIEKVYEVLDSGEYSGLSDDAQKLFKGKAIEKLKENRENAFLSKKLATVDKNVELEGFDLGNFLFDGSSLISEEVIEYFKNFEFFSLIPEGQLEKPKTWKDMGLKVQTVINDNQLHELKSLIKKGEEIVLDTETTSLTIMEAELVGVSIYLDDKNIYYINRLHEGEKVSDIELLKFLDFLLGSDILIIGHNIKYDLEILELFKRQVLQSPQKHREVFEKIDSELSEGQMSLGL